MSDRQEWQEAFDRSPMRAARFETMSGVPLDAVYGPEGAELPGSYPYTRGPYASMYRSRLWTMRQFAGFGTAEDTNGRFKELLRAGGDGLSTAFDMPTLLGRDSDDPLAKGEVGRAGVAVDTMADMEALFSGIDLGKVSTSMTINSPAAPILAMYVGVADKTGVERSALSGTLQNDILKEYQAQKEYVFPPRPSVRLVTDVMRFCTAELPRWHPVSVSGYHIREAGSTAAQELAFTLANGFAYVEAAMNTGLAVDDFAPRLSFFFNAHSDFFEEIAKYRAARRIWARWMREHYGAHLPRSTQLRFHTQTAGVSLTAQQPEVNLVRVAIEALAGVLGGTQSLHTDAFDEALALPTEHAARLALRTQQVIAEESGAVHVADPLGGSWFVEELTDELERQAEQVFAHLEDAGSGSILEGVLACIEDGWFVERDRRRRLRLPVQDRPRRVDPGGGERIRRGRRGGAVHAGDRPGGRDGPAREAGRGQAGPGRRCGAALVAAHRHRRRRPRRQPDAGPHRGGPPRRLRGRGHGRHGDGVRSLLRAPRRLSMAPPGADERPLRVLMAKVGLDGHDRGLRVVARILRDAGCEVVYAGLRQSPETIAAMSAQEDVDVVGVSMHNGAHLTLAPAVVAALRGAGLETPVVIGGIVPPADVERLLAGGVAAVLGPGASNEEVVATVRAAAGRAGPS